MNNRGMIGNLIAGFVTILIGLALIPQVMLIVNQAICSNSTSYNQTQSTLLPLGKTDSFGGGGADTHFGGYDGQVVHRTWDPVVTYQQSQEVCANANISDASKTLLQIVPMIFAITILLAGIGIAWSTLRSVGLE